MHEKLITDWITAIGTAVSALASIVLFIVAIVQLRGLRDQIEQTANQERSRNTLDEIKRMESDSIVQQARARLWAASENGTDYTKLTADNRFDAITLLNYLEGLAVGIFQDVYVEGMARDYLQEVVRKAVKALIKGEPGNGWKADRGMFQCSDFAELCKLYDQWFSAPASQTPGGLFPELTAE